VCFGWCQVVLLAMHDICHSVSCCGLMSASIHRALTVFQVLQCLDLNTNAVLCHAVLCCLQTGVLGGLQLWDERVGPNPISKSSNSWGHTGCGLMDTQMGLQRQVRPGCRNVVTVARLCDNCTVLQDLHTLCTGSCTPCVLPEGSTRSPTVRCVVNSGHPYDYPAASASSITDLAGCMLTIPRPASHRVQRCGVPLGDTHTPPAPLPPCAACW
jgi:hypothetical protein